MSTYGSGAYGAGYYSYIPAPTALGPGVLCALPSMGPVLTADLAVVLVVRCAIDIAPVLRATLTVEACGPR